MHSRNAEAGIDPKIGHFLANAVSKRPDMHCQAKQGKATNQLNANNRSEQAARVTGRWSIPVCVPTPERGNEQPHLASGMIFPWRRLLRNKSQGVDSTGVYLVRKKSDRLSTRRAMNKKSSLSMVSERVW